MPITSNVTSVAVYNIECPSKLKSHIGKTVKINGNEFNNFIQSENFSNPTHEHFSNYEGFKGTTCSTYSWHKQSGKRIAPTTSHSLIQSHLTNLQQNKDNSRNNYLKPYPDQLAKYVDVYPNSPDKLKFAIFDLNTCKLNDILDHASKSKRRLSVL